MFCFIKFKIIHDFCVFVTGAKICREKRYQNCPKHKYKNFSVIIIKK